MRHLLLLSLLFVFACGKDDNECPDKTIGSIQPNDNPVGYEVVINTSGFTSAATVRFGQKETTSRAGGEGGQIIAKIPTGLAGNVQVTVEEGDCLARFDDFLVLGAYPGGIQEALPVIVVPLAGNVPTTGFTNEWKNAADSTNSFILLDNGTAELLPNESFERLEGKLNPISGMVDITLNRVRIEIDRSGSNGEDEAFEGFFIVRPTNIPNLPIRNFYLLLTSQTTGRQLLLFPPP